MTLAFSGIDTTTLDTIESSIGTDPKLLLFSGAQAGSCALPDPLGLLATLTLPTDWMSAAVGNSKAKLGTWSGTATDAGDIASFRLKSSADVVHMEGSVTTQAGTGDLRLNVVGIGIGQVITITGFTLSFSIAADLPLVAGTLVKTQGAQTLSATATVVTAAAGDDSWAKVSNVYPAGDLRNGPVGLSQGWWTGCMIRTTGDIHLAQGRPSTAGRGNFFFRRSLGQWERTNTEPNLPNWWRHATDGNIIENYEIEFDQDRNSLWRSNPTPGTLITGPLYGESRYDIATDEWFTPYPSTGGTYTPVTPGDTAHYTQANQGNIINGTNGCWSYLNNALYTFGAFEIGAKQSLKKRDLTTGVVTTLLSSTLCPPWTKAMARSVNLRSSMDYRTRQLYTMANDAEVWVCNLNDAVLSWKKITYSGAKPNTPVPPARAGTAPENTYTDWGVLGCMHEDAAQFIAWCSEAVQSNDAGANIRKTWVLDLSTKRWRDGPSALGGDTVPTGDVLGVQQSIHYNPVALTVDLVQHTPEVWSFSPEYTGAGELISFPLPTGTGSTYGVNFVGFPFRSNSATKHANMAYCPNDNRIYVTGGDHPSSATDGCWSMDVGNGTWLLETGRPVDGVFAPHAAQDQMGWAWMPSRNKFILWPGVYFSYAPVGDPIRDLAQGAWFFDPLTKIWEQHLEIWSGSLNVSGWTGQVYGGIYNPADDTIYTISTGGTACSRFRISDWTRLPVLNLGTTWYTAGGSNIWQLDFRAMQVLLNGNIYCIGNANVGGTWRAFMGKYNIAAGTMSRCSTPTLPSGVTLGGYESRFAASGTKLIFPVTINEQGIMDKGILIYDTIDDFWCVDWQVPAVGAFVGNSLCGLPDGRVAWAGAVGVQQQSHFWLYQPAT